MDELRYDSFAWAMEQRNPTLPSIRLQLLDSEEIFMLQEYRALLHKVQFAAVGQTFHFRKHTDQTIGQSTRDLMNRMWMAGDLEMDELNKPPEPEEFQEEDFQEEDIVIPSSQFEVAAQPDDTEETCMPESQVQDA